MTKRKSINARKQKKVAPPWKDLLGGRPIVRMLRRDDAQLGGVAEECAAYVQYQLMLKLKEHYGIEGERGWRPWYELALKIASDLDVSLTIHDPSPRRNDRTAPKWRGGPEGSMMLLDYKLAAEDLGETNSVKVKQIAVLQALQSTPRYRNMSLNNLKNKYNVAKRYAEQHEGGNWRIERCGPAEGLGTKRMVRS